MNLDHRDRRPSFPVSVQVVGCDGFLAGGRFSSGSGLTGSVVGGGAVAAFLVPPEPRLTLDACALVLSQARGHELEYLPDEAD